MTKRRVAPALPDPSETLPRGEQPQKTEARGENPKEGEEEAVTAEDKEVGCPADDEAVTGDTPGGPDVKTQKRKTRQEKKRNETKERQKVG